MDEKMPVYVKVDEYKEVLDVVNLIKSKIRDAKETIEKINVLRNEEDIELQEWKNTLDETTEKMEFINKVLFEPAAL